MYFTIITFILSYLLFNALIVAWFWKALGKNRMLKYGVSALLSLLALLYPIFIFANRGTSATELFLLRVGAIWAGLFLYIFMFIAVIYVIDGFYSRKRKSKEARLLTNGKGCLLVVIATLTVLVWGSFNARYPAVTEVTIDITPKEQRGEKMGEQIPTREIKIGVISDIHLGRLIYAKNLDRMVDELIPLKPDLVLLPGDILDDHLVLDIPAIKASLARLNPALGIWASLGNHEYHSGPIDKSVEIIGEMGIRLLKDNWAVVQGSPDSNAGALLLVGRNDLTFTRLSGKPRKTLDQILSDVPSEWSGVPLIVMDHQPQGLEEAEQAGAALELSGHTHYGQLWPMNHVVSYLYENAKGHTQRGKTHYVVSSGAGTWGPPLRTTARSEVVLIRLKYPVEPVGTIEPSPRPDQP